MSSVKAFYPPEEHQVALLMGLLFREVSSIFAGEDWATIFYDDLTPKPAYDAMLTSLREATPGVSPRSGR